MKTLRAVHRLVRRETIERAQRAASGPHRARTAVLTIPGLAAVAVCTDAVSAVPQGPPGLELDQRVVEDVANAGDPVEAGIEAAVAKVRTLLAIDGVDLRSGSGAGTWDRGRTSRLRSAYASGQKWPRRE